MANISVTNLHFAGVDLLLDSESFMTDLVDIEFIDIKGGSGIIGIEYPVPPPRHTVYF